MCEQASIGSNITIFYAQMIVMTRYTFIIKSKIVNTQSPQLKGSRMKVILIKPAYFATENILIG